VAFSVVDVFSRQVWGMIVARVVCEDLNFDQIVRVCKGTGRSCVFNKDSFTNTLVFVYKRCYIVMQIRYMATFHL